MSGLFGSGGLLEDWELDPQVRRSALLGMGSPMSLKQRANDVYGLDPDVKRSAFLPITGSGGAPLGWDRLATGLTGGGWPSLSKDATISMALPEAAVDVMRSALLPRHAYEGGDYTLGDVVQMAADVSGTAGVTGLLDPQKGAVLGMNVWHGGPNKWAPEPGFPHGRPRLDKMGTGEGNQAYGHGFYSAEKPGVAKSYAENLSNQRLRKADEYIQFWDKHKDSNGMVAGLDGNAFYQKAPDLDAGVLPEAIRDDFLRIQAKPDTLDSTLYKLDLPDEDVAKYLDWDAPLSQQPEAVQAALRNIPSAAEFMDATKNWNRPATGQDLHGYLQKQLGEGKDAIADRFRKAGIPGLKYYDGMSRNTSKGEIIDVFQDGGKWKSKIRLKGAQGSFQGAPTDVFTTSKPFDTKDAAEAWAKSKIDGGTRNYVTWDQGVLDRTKVLERNGEALGLPMDEASRMARAREMYRAKVQELLDSGEYDAVGLRTTDTPAKSGDISRVWDNGDPTDEFLRGLSVTDATNFDDAWRQHLGADVKRGDGYYPGEYTSIVGGNVKSYGEDLGELVIQDPTVFFQRHKRAAFDPAKADSADLLAMNGNPALSMLFAHNPETSERKPVPEIMTYEDLMKFYRAGGA
jgi:hypothetical protein